MQTILIPTDFTIESLGLLKTAMSEHPSGQLSILFVHGMIAEDSIQDLLFRSPSKSIRELQSADFTEACAVIRNKFSSRIVSLRTVLFMGKTVTAFENLLEANHVDEVVVAENYPFRPASRRSIDLHSFLYACALPKLYVDWEPIRNMPEKDKLAELFAL